MVDYNILDAHGVLVGCIYKEGGEWIVDVPSWDKDSIDKTFSTLVEAREFVTELQYRIVPTPMVGYTGGDG